MVALEIRFLTVEDAIEIHRHMIDHYGGGTYEILDQGKLESALAQPMQSFGGQYLHASIPAMAGAYLFHVNQAHAFEQGNKRVAAGCAYQFLRDNGYALSASQDQFENICMKVAQGAAKKDDVIVFFEKYAIPDK